MCDAKANVLHNAILSHCSTLSLETTLRLSKHNPNALSDHQFQLGSNISPLILACAYSSVDIVRVLLDHGADLNLANNLEETPLLHAACSGKLEIVRHLVANRAEVDKPDVYGRSPLYFVAQKGYEKIMKILLNAGANPNMQDHTGRTVLSRAVCWGNYDIVELLLNRGVKILAVDILEGVLFQQTKIVELLESKMSSSRDHACKNSNVME